MAKTYSMTIVALLVLLLSCKTRAPRHVLKLSEYSKETRTPPGTIQLENDTYLDEAEITNFSYIEYLYWTTRVYGSQKCKSLLPDTNSWNRLSNIKLLYFLPDYYLRHPSFKDYPVVGVTNEQALKFCKWRSDRVMEYILISYGIIEPDFHPDSVNAFTTEKYFTGQYRGIKPNPYLKYYPVYSLPDSLTYMKAVKFADSLNKANYKYKGKNKDIIDLINVRCSENIPLTCDSFSCKTQPTKKAYVEEYSKNLIINLFGNVRELTDVKAVTFGGSFIDSCTTIRTKYFYRTDTSTNAFTGFRCICKWKQWP